MIPEELEKIKAMLAETSSDDDSENGEWIARELHECLYDVEGIEYLYSAEHHYEPYYTKGNAEWIAQSREICRQLLEEIERLRLLAGSSK